MAVLCVRVKDNLRRNHPMPEKAARPGDIVEVFEDGVSPGRKIEQSDNWIVVKVPRIPAERLRFMIETDAQDAESKPTAYRKNRFALEALSAAQLAKGKAQGLVYDQATDDFERDAILDQLIDKQTERTAKQDGRVIDGNSR